MRTFSLLLALCATTVQIGAFQISSTRAGTMSRLSMTSNKDFYPFSSKPSLRSNTELFAEKEDEVKNKAARQLLGIKGGDQATNIWAIRLQLCKPVTWIPLIWGVACGAAASGNYNTWNPFGPEQDLSLVAQDAAKAISCMFLSGPILTGIAFILQTYHVHS
jgi:hypothetical protein